MSQFNVLARQRLLIVAALCAAPILHSQTLTWDANTTNGGPQNGAGTWNTTLSNWWNGSANTTWVNSTSAVAQIGTTPAVTNSPAISITEDITLTELRFLAVTSGTVATGNQYTLNGDIAGRVLNFGANGLITMEDRSSGGSQFVGLGSNLRLAGTNLTIKKHGAGTAFQYLTLGMSQSPDLTGNLTIGGSIYATVASPNTFGAIDRIIVEAGGSVVLSGTNPTYLKPLSLAGFGNSLNFSGTSYGAIRFTSNNTVVSGGILLTDDAGVHTNFSGANGTTGIVINSPITDGGNNHDFHRFSFTRGNGTLALAAANTYGGTTVLGRALSSYGGGITILDFTAPTSPSDNILYHGLTKPGNISFIGGNSPAVLRLTGKPGESHGQWFGDLNVAGTHSALELQSGQSGSMNASFGSITRTDPAATLSITGPASGAVTTTHPDGFAGPWLSYTSGENQRSWGQISGGTMMSGYAGDIAYTRGTSLGSAPYLPGSNVGITSSSTGSIAIGAGTTQANTLTMGDYSADREVLWGTGQTLRLGAQGGIQLVSGAGALLVGEAGTTGVLTAGTALDTSGQLFLSNHSASSLLTIQSKITNNGTGAVTLVVNGAPGSRTVLTNSNTHSGGTQISSGILEVRNNGALGSTGAVTIVDGATLALSGGVTLSRALNAVGGFGDGNNGAIRSLSGNNVISGNISQNAMFLISADADASLTIQSSSVISYSSMLTWGGAGSITVNSALTGSGAITKMGSGLTIFAGTNAYTGATTVSGGTLRLGSATALGTSSSVTIGAGGTLDLNGFNTDRGFLINGTGGASDGALINNNAGSLSTLTGTAALTTASVIGGPGSIAINNATGLTGNVLMTKKGAGTVTIASTAASARTGVSQIDAGTLRLQAATVLATAGTGAIVLNGGTLSLGYNATGTLTNVVNVLSAGTIVADRAGSGDGGIVLTLSSLNIGGSTLTVKAGDNVANGTMGLTLGATSMGGAGMLAPGDPVFDVQSSSTAAMTLTLGALSDQGIAPRQITFQNSSPAGSSVTLATAATSLVNGTLINVAGIGPVNLNLNTAGALGTLAQITVGSGNSLTLGAAQTIGSLSGSGTVRASGAFVLTVGNPLNTTPYNTSFSGGLENGTGTLALTKAGLSTLTLSGVSSYSGATIVSAGILKLGSMTALGASSGVTVSAGGTLDLNGQSTDRNFSSIGGPGFAGSGAIVNTAASAGTITGTVVLGSVTSLGGPGDITIANATGVTGNQQLTKVGGGKLTIINTTTTSTRTGANRLESGTLRLESAELTAVSPLGTSGAWTLNGGTLSLGFDTANALMTGAVTVTDHATVITDVATAGNAAVSHTLGALTVGSHTLTVGTGANVASAGTQGLVFGAVTVNGNARFDVQNASSATTRLTLGALSDLAVSPRTLTFANTGLAASGSIVTLGTLAGSLVDGTVVNLDNGPQGGVNVNLNVVGALGSLAQVNVNGNSTLTTGITGVVIGSLGGTGTVNASGAFTLIVGNGNMATAPNTDFSGTLANGTGTLALTKAGTGTLKLSGDNSNTHTGLTTVNTGTLVLAKSAGNAAIGGALTIGVAAASTAGKATVRLEGNEQIVNTAALTMNAGSTLNLNGYTQSVLTFSTAFGATVTGGGTLVIGQTGGTMTFTGASSISSTLQLTGSIAATRTMAVTNVTDIMHISGNVTQGATNGSIVAGNSAQTALGTLILSGNNSYNGATTVSSGILNIRNGAALGNVTSGTSVTSGGTLQIQGGITTTAEGLTLNGGTGFAGANGINMQTGALVNVSGVNNYAGLVTLAVSDVTIASDSGTLNLTHAGTMNGAVGLTLAGAGDGSISSIIGAAVTSVTKTGTGTWTLKGANTSTGPIQINAGTLRLGDGTTGRWVTGPNLTFTGSGAFEFGGSTAASSQAFGALTLTSGDGTLRVEAPVSGTNGLAFNSLATPSAGAGLDIVAPANTNVTIAGAVNTHGIIDPRITYNGADFAATASGVVAAAATTPAVVNLASGNPSPYSIGASFSQSSSEVVNAGLKFSGAHVLTLNDGVLLTINNGTDTAGGLLIAGGVAAVIANQGTAVGLTTAGSGDIVIRTHAAGDSLALQVPITSSTTGGLTKNGLGTLTLASANSYTGTTTINAGTVIAGNTSALSTSTVVVGVGAVLDLNGLLLANAVTLNGAGPGNGGALINNSATAASIGAVTIGLGHGSGGIGAAIGGSGNILVNGALEGKGMLVKTGSGMLSLGDNAGTPVASTRTGVVRIDAGILRISNSANALGTPSTAIILNGGTLSLGSATAVAAHPTSLTASSTVVSDAFEPGNGLTHTLGALAIGSQTLTIKAGPSVNTAGTNAGITFGATTLLGDAVFDVQSPTAAVAGSTTLTLGALNDQGIAKSITFENSGAATNPGIVTMAAAMASLVDGTTVNVNSGANAGIVMNLNAAGALGTLAQVTVTGSSVLNLGAAQTIGSLAGNGHVTGPFVLTVGNPNSSTSLSTTYSGIFGFGGTATGLTKAGLGTLTLSGANAYTGATIVSGGILKLDSAGALGATSGVTINTVGSVDLNGQTTNRNFVGINGPGAAGGGAIINSSALTGTITGTVALTGNSNLGGAGNISIVNPTGVSGNFQLTKVGNGTLTVIGTTTTSARTGANRIDGGLLRLESAALTAVSPLGTSGAWTLNGGTLSLGFDAANALMTGAVILTNDAVVISDVATPGNAAVTHTMGAVTLVGQNLSVRAGSNVAAGGVQGMTFGAVTLNGNPTIDVQNTGLVTTRLTLGALSDLAIGPRTLTLTNRGTASTNSLVLLGTAATSLVDGTIIHINEGAAAGVSLNLGVAGALGTLAQINVNGNSSLILGAAQTLGSLAGSGSVSASGAFTLTVGNLLSASERSTTFSGSLSNGAGTLALTKAGLGTLTLSGTNSYTGATIVSGGTLKLSNGAALGGSTAVTISAGGTIDLNGQSTDRNFSSVSGTGHNGIGAVINSALAPGTITGAFVQGAVAKIGGTGAIVIQNTGGITGNALLTKVGTGTLTVISTNASVRTGGNQIDEGTLRLQSANAITSIGTGPMALNGGTLSLGYDGSGTVAGAVNVMTDSSIVVDRATAGAGTGVLTMGVLAIGSSTLSVMAGPNLTSGSAALTLGATSLGGSALLPGNPVFDVQSTAAATMTLTLGALSDQAIAPRTITFQNSSLHSSHVVMAAAATSLVDGTIVNLANAGGPLTLSVNAANGLGMSARTTVASGNTLSLAASQTLASLHGDGTVTAAAPAVLTIGNSPGSAVIDSIFTGLLSGAGNLSLIKAGPGSLTLGGSSTFTGGTTVSAGTLILANSGGSATGSGPVSMLAGTKLAGGGRIEASSGNSVSIFGTIEIGTNDSTAAQMEIVTSGTGKLFVGSSGILVFDIVSGVGEGDNTDDTLSADRLTIGGTLTMMAGATLKVQYSGAGTWTAGDQWRLLDWTTLTNSNAGGFTRYELPVLDGDLGWDISQLSSLGILAVVVVPEPGRAGLLLLGITTLLLQRRRKP